MNRGDLNERKETIMNTSLRTLARRVSVTTLSTRLNLYCALRRVAGPATAYRLSFFGWVQS